MLWDADPLNEQGRFSLELSSRCRESDLPLSLSFLAKRDTRIALPEESEGRVRSRIVPEDRHNIVEVLLANGLAEYNEVSLLATSMGRSSDDDFLVYEVDVPDEMATWHDRLTNDLSTTAPRGETGPACKTRADQIIAAVKRTRDKNAVYYAYVGLPEAENEHGRISAPSTQPPRQSSAQIIGEQIRSRRIGVGLTQKQLAAKAGITQSVLSRIESGKGNPTLSLLEELAAALGTSMEIRLAP